MPEINNDEIITEVFFWLKKVGNKYENSCIEYQALKLTNNAKCQFVEIEIEKNGKDLIYKIVATGTKQKLLLLKFMMDAWLQGAMFKPQFETEK